jgi:hypothetical protein
MAFCYADSHFILFLCPSNTPPPFYVNSYWFCYFNFSVRTEKWLNYSPARKGFMNSAEANWVAHFSAKINSSERGIATALSYGNRVAVGIETVLRAGRSVFESQQRKEACVFCEASKRARGLPKHFYNGYRGWCRWGVVLTTHLRRVLRLRMSGVIHLIPQDACMTLTGTLPLALAASILVGVVKKARAVWH